MKAMTAASARAETSRRRIDKFTRGQGGKAFYGTLRLFPGAHLAITIYADGRVAALLCCENSDDNERTFAQTEGSDADGCRAGQPWRN